MSMAASRAGLFGHFPPWGNQGAKGKASSRSLPTDVLLKKTGNYSFSNVIPTILFLLGLVSTIATFSPALAQYEHIGEVGWSLAIVGFVWANFSVYRKHALPRFSTKVMDKLECGTVASKTPNEVQPFIRILVQVVNNSNKNCSIVKIRIYADYPWEIDFIADTSVVTNDGKIALPYSVPAHEARHLRIQAYLRVVSFNSKYIHFNQLILEITDHRGKKYSDILTNERISASQSEFGDKMQYAFANRDME